MAEEIGVIGLGRVGMPVAKAYLEAGYSVWGYDVRSEALATFESMGGIPAQNAGELLRHTNTVLVLVLNDPQVLEVISGEHGLLNGAHPGSTIICMSTINRSNLEAVAEACAQRQVMFIDCPFTGGPARVPGGDLTLIAAAPPEALAAARPVLKVIGHIVHAGDSPGLGQAVKHCNQLLVGATHAATMEVIALARKLDLDPSLVSGVLAGGIAGSDYFRLLADSVLNHKPSPGGLGQMCKDVSIVVNTTRQVRMPALVATAASQYFLMAEALGMQNREGADLIEVVEHFSGRQAEL
jgi:3-hydroxyisobutyrate dehydrogenase-like beta-hydroxyacid dehydrogenase